MTATLTAVEAAAAFVARGWRPFPLDHPDLPRCAGLHRPDKPCEGGPKRGKHPCVAYGTFCASEPNDKTLAHYFGGAPRNIGIACGPSGLLVIDEDAPNALSMLAADLGEGLPKTYRVRTSRGWHWYFEAPTHVELGNRSGRLAEYHIDVRGGRGKGGYVVAAGSVHHTGHVYAAEDEFVVPAPLPEWLIAEIQAPAGATGDGQGAPGAWDDEPRYGTALDLTAQYQRHVDGIRSRGGEFRHELFLAARDGYRLQALGLLDVATMAEDLRRAVVRVWGAEPDERDRHIVNEEARVAAERSPWALIGPPPAASASIAGDGAGADGFTMLDPAEVAAINAEAAAMEEAARLQADVEYTLYRRKVNRLADEAERPRLPKPFADYGTWDEDLESVPPPAMMVGQLVPERAVGFLGGPSGSYKSFVAVALAVGSAYGRNVMDYREFTVGRARKVLYVAAEGSEGVSLRNRAARRRAGITQGRQLMVYRRAVDLTSEHDFAELRAFILEQGFEFLIVDTFRQTTLGVNENDNTEVGLVLGRLLGLRDEHGVGSMLVDHTAKTAQGLADLGGAGAKRANADYVLMIDLPNGERGRDQQRTLRVAKLKDKVDGRTWPIRLETVPEVTDEDGDPSAVAVIGEVGVEDNEAWLMEGLAWTDRRWALPADVEALTAPGWRAAKDLARYMRSHAADLQGTGESRSEAIKALQANSGRGGLGAYGKDTTTARRGWSLLVAIGRLESVTKDTTSKSHWLAKPDDPRPPVAENEPEQDH